MDLSPVTPLLVENTNNYIQLDKESLIRGRPYPSKDVVPLDKYNHHYLESCRISLRVANLLSNDYTSNSVMKTVILPT